jgi:hypothetical protein
MRPAPRWNGSVSVETSCGASLSPVFSTVSMTDSGPMAVLSCTVLCSARFRNGPSGMAGSAADHRLTATCAAAMTVYTTH